MENIHVYLRPARVLRLLYFATGDKLFDYDLLIDNSVIFRNGYGDYLFSCHILDVYESACAWFFEGYPEQENS